MNRPPQPIRQVCPLCSRDDAIRIDTIGPGVWRYTCSNTRHSMGPYSWESTVTDRIDQPAAEGKAADLGLYEDLPRCLVAGEPFVEYGVVEHRYSELRPQLYQQLIRDYSHTRIERNNPYTASVFIASALGWLADHGEVLYRVGPATGHWSYNGIISYWALPSETADSDEMLIWEHFALDRGLAP